MEVREGQDASPANGCLWFDQIGITVDCIGIARSEDYPAHIEVAFPRDNQLGVTGNLSLAVGAEDNVRQERFGGGVDLNRDIALDRRVFSKLRGYSEASAVDATFSIDVHKYAAGDGQADVANDCVFLRAVTLICVCAACCDGIQEKATRDDHAEVAVANNGRIQIDAFSGKHDPVERAAGNDQRAVLGFIRGSNDDLLTPEIF